MDNCYFENPNNNIPNYPHHHHHHDDQFSALHMVILSPSSSDHHHHHHHQFMSDYDHHHQDQSWSQSTESSEKTTSDATGILISGATSSNNNNINNIKLCKNNGIEQKKGETSRRIAFRTRSELEVMDDGYKWRKYGKKSVKNSPYPRNYYKCSSGGCNVKKRVERDREDPCYVITTYEGVHNHETPCGYYSHFSSIHNYNNNAFPLNPNPQYP